MPSVESVEPIEPVEEARAEPCAAALVAGTVALMTMWADPCPHCTSDLVAQRLLLARKIVSNLSLMEQHPAFDTELQQVMAHANRRWMGLLPTGQLAGGAPAATAMAMH